jgi:hypothetical protein
MSLRPALPSRSSNEGRRPRRDGGLLRSRAPEAAAIGPPIGSTAGARSSACRLLRFTVLGHASPISITPLVDQAAALVKGFGAFRADGIAASLGDRAGEGHRSHRESRDCRCRCELGPVVRAFHSWKSRICVEQWRVWNGSRKKDLCQYGHCLRRLVTPSFRSATTPRAFANHSGWPCRDIQAARPALIWRLPPWRARRREGLQSCKARRLPLPIRVCSLSWRLALLSRSRMIVPPVMAVNGLLLRKRLSRAFTEVTESVERPAEGLRPDRLIGCGNQPVIMRMRTRSLRTK